MVEICSFKLTVVKIETALHVAAAVMNDNYCRKTSERDVVHALASA